MHPFHRFIIRAAAVFAATAYASIASAGWFEISWSADGRFKKKVVVQPDKFFELWDQLMKGDAVALSFNSDQVLDFDVHYHTGSDVILPAKQHAVTQVFGELDVTVAQAYCWMWQNKTAVPSTLTVLLEC